MINAMVTAQHVSLDIETLGLGDSALIASIGAVRFWPDRGEVGTGPDTFYRIIDLDLSPEGQLDLSTVLWWFRQDADVRDKLFVHPDPELTVPLHTALTEFSEWLHSVECWDLQVWQRGSKDAQWLESAYSREKLSLPFHHGQVCEQRTLSRYIPHDRAPDSGSAHDALADATWQAEELCRTFKVLNGALALLDESD